MENMQSNREFISFLGKIRKVIKKIVSRSPLTIAVVVICNDSVKIYQKSDFSGLILKRLYHSKYSQFLIDYFKSCGISEENEDYLPLNFKIKPGSYIYYFINSDYKKI